ncbi:MAG: GNAT family N-acetyltransferase [Clostridia bacterium]|nr:GNAT family N-acetyltransferase [Clostridia bacterium]
MEIRDYKDYNEDEILRLYTSVGWTAYTNNPASLAGGFEHSLCVLAAYENDELIGVIRVVGDGFTIVYVQDILVHPQWQHHHVGAALLRAVLERFSNVRQIVLATDDTPKTVAFYKSMGFSELSEMGCRGFMRVSMTSV